MKGLASQPIIGEHEGNVVVRPSPGVESAFAVGSATYVTLTRAQAERAWRLRLGGSERLVLTSASPYTDDGGKTLTLSATDASDLVAYVFPAPQGVPREGLFGKMVPESFTMPPSAFLQWERKTPGDWAFSLPALLDGYDDLWLEIDYVGTMAEVFVDGKLYTDHRNNGAPWRVALRRFFADGKPHTFRFVAKPFDPRVKGLPASALPKDAEEAKGAFRSIRSVSEVAVKLHF